MIRLFAITREKRASCSCVEVPRRRRCVLLLFYTLLRRAPNAFSDIRAQFGLSRLIDVTVLTHGILGPLGEVEWAFRSLGLCGWQLMRTSVPLFPFSITRLFEKPKSGTDGQREGVGSDVDLPVLGGLATRGIRIGDRH